MTDETVHKKKDAVARGNAPTSGNPAVKYITRLYN
jgi:hypothetical protein